MVGPGQRAQRRENHGIVSEGSHSAALVIGGFVGGILGPIVVVTDPHGGHHGLILIAFAAVMIAWGAVTWVRTNRRRRAEGPR